MKKIILILAMIIMTACTVSCETVGEGPCINTEVSDAV